MSHQIDALITSANNNPVGFKGHHYDVYWRGGRVYSEARDAFKAATIDKHAPRLFTFMDCGEKPIGGLRFEVMVLCSQVGRSVHRCCATEECQRQHMSQVFPTARGVPNF